MESSPPNFDLAKSDPTVVDFVIIRFVGYNLALESGMSHLVQYLITGWPYGYYDYSRWSNVLGISRLIAQIARYSLSAMNVVCNRDCQENLTT